MLPENGSYNWGLWVLTGIIKRTTWFTGELL